MEKRGDDKDTGGKRNKRMRDKHISLVYAVQIPAMTCNSQKAKEGLFHVVSATIRKVDVLDLESLSRCFSAFFFFFFFLFSFVACVSGKAAKAATASASSAAPSPSLGALLSERVDRYRFGKGLVRYGGIEDGSWTFDEFRLDARSFFFFFFFFLVLPPTASWCRSTRLVFWMPSFVLMTRWCCTLASSSSRA